MKKMLAQALWGMRFSLTKFLLQMKLILLLILIPAFQAFSFDGLSQERINLELKGQRISTVLKYIEKNYEYRFFYSDKAGLNKFKVDIVAKQATIDYVMQSLLATTPFSFKKMNKDLVVIIGYENDTLEHTVAGKVINESGTALGDVSIIEKGTNNGVTTSEEGTFTIKVKDENALLVISAVGYLSKEVAVKDFGFLEVQLTASLNQMDEVIVVGYGVQKKVSSTAAVSSIKGSDIENVPVANISSALTGRIPGLISAQGSGEPGNDDAELYIRGMGTTGNKAPLVIVDGVPRELNRLDPNVIESVTLLKDAAAVAPYGVAGANGVVLITTKSGKTGKVALSYKGYTGWQSPTDVPKLLNSYEYASMRNLATKNENPAAALPFKESQLNGYKKTVEGAQDADPDKYPNSDAMSFFRDANTTITGHSLTASGGQDIASYFVGLGYLYQSGLYATTGSNRYNLTAKLSSKVTRTTTMALSINGSQQQIARPWLDPITVFERAIKWNPTVAIEFTNGYLATNNGNITNTMYANTLSGSRLSDRTEIFSQFSIQQELPFIKGLSMKGVFNYDPTTVSNKNWQGGGEAAGMVFYNIDTTKTPYVFTPVTLSLSKTLYQNSEQRKRITWQGYLNYHRKFGAHDITGLLVAESRRTTYSVFSAQRTNGILDIDELDFGNPNQTYWSNGGNSSQTSQVGYVYRAAYNNQGKYLLEASGRYDGNYYFAPGHKFGFFPAFSAGWRISEEKFMKSITWIDNLKIRGSWGISGNLAGSPFQYLSTYAIDAASSYVFNGSVYQGAKERLEPNPDITWERAKKSNIGLEVSLFSRKLNIEADYFREKRSNMLVSPATVVPAEYGIAVAQENAGIMSNRGLDLNVNGVQRIGDLLIDLTFNFTYTKNKLIQTFENAATYNDPNRRRTGRPLNTIFGYVAERLFQVEDDKNGDGKIDDKDGFPVQTLGGVVAPGDIKYKDLNGDGKIDATDQTAIGNPNIPGIIYGFSPRFSYKGLDLSILIQGATKTSAFIRQELVWLLSGANTTTYTLDYWTPDNRDAKVPRPYGASGNTNNQQTSTWWVWDISYLRIKSFELGYKIPEALLKKTPVKSFRIFASGQNLFTSSIVKGIVDPELSSTGSNTRGWYYPQQRAFSVGANITL